MSSRADLRKEPTPDDEKINRIDKFYGIAACVAILLFALVQTARPLPDLFDYHYSFNAMGSAATLWCNLAMILAISLIFLMRRDPTSRWRPALSAPMALFFLFYSEETWHSFTGRYYFISPDIPGDFWLLTILVALASGILRKPLRAFLQKKTA